jgi:hypothetical protein
VDIADVKKELSSDEKVLENVFKLETLYKKHKLKIWGAIVALVLFFVGQTVMTSIHEEKLVTANEAFLTLQTKSDDVQALNVLKENNPALFELYSYAQASKKQDIKTLQSLSGSTNEVIADASQYTAAVLSKKPVDSKLYKELSLFQEAYLAIVAGDKKTANDKLELIDERSPLAVITGFLKHSIIKAN